MPLSKTERKVRLSRKRAVGGVVLPRGRVPSRYLTGRGQVSGNSMRNPCTPASKILESRQVHERSDEPWFALDTGWQHDSEHERSGSEHSDGAAAGAYIEQTPHQQVRITGGTTPLLGYYLAAGETLTTPPFFVRLQRTWNRRRLAHPPRVRTHRNCQTIRHENTPIIYNSWEATHFDLNETGQLALSDQSCKPGVERYLSWTTVVSATQRRPCRSWCLVRKPTKFPRGFGRLFGTVRELGMDFGIWVEPEMVTRQRSLFETSGLGVHFEGRRGPKLETSSCQPGA